MADSMRRAVECAVCQATNSKFSVNVNCHSLWVIVVVMYCCNVLLL